MEEVSIRPTSARVGLRIYGAERSHGGNLEYFTVEIADPTIRATVRVYADRAEGLLDLFEAMARDWRGWSGVKEWASLEGEFGISCTQDKMGHVCIAITLTDTLNLDHWSVHASAETEAGQLDALAASMRRFVAGPGHAS